MDVAGSEANKDPLDSCCCLGFYNVDWVMLFPYAWGILKSKVTNYYKILEAWKAKQKPINNLDSKLNFLPPSMVLYRTPG